MAASRKSKVEGNPAAKGRGAGTSARAGKQAGAAKDPASKARKGAKRGAAAAAALEELLALLPELDEEGVAFLLEQARTHRYNMEVERLNAVAARTVDRGEAGRAAPSGSGGLVREGAEAGLRVERSSDGSTYHIVANGVWKMFSVEEMSALVRMTMAEDSEEEVGRRLYAWLDRERRDALGDLGIARPSSPALIEIVRLLRKSFPAAGAAKGRG